MQTRYIADLHLFDSYSYSWRDYLDMNIDQYASMLIDNWNGVCDEDTLTIIVGDVGRYCPKTLTCIKQLRGIKVLVVGNHDVSWGRELYNPELFQGTHNFIKDSGIFVQHTPCDIDTSGVSYYIHGHHHRYDVQGMQQELRRYARDVYRLNCAADLIGHTPRTLQELIFQKELLLEQYRERGLL